MEGTPTPEFVVESSNETHFLPGLESIAESMNVFAELAKRKRDEGEVVEDALAAKLVRKDETVGEVVEEHEEDKGRIYDAQREGIQLLAMELMRKEAELQAAQQEAQLQQAAQAMEQTVAELQAVEEVRMETKKRRTSASYSELWNQRFKEIEEFKERHGHCNVPRHFAPLGEWVKSQRKKYKQGTLSQDRIDKLNSLGFQWSFDLMRKSRDTTADMLVPKVHADLPGLIQGLPGMIVTEGGVTVPVDDPVALAIAAEDVAKITQEEQWNKSFEELKEFKEANGHLSVPSKDKLSKWIKAQRTALKKGMLSEVQKEKLDSIGFEWTPTTVVPEKMVKHLDETWNKRYEELKAFHEKHNHCNVPHKHGKLGSWVTHQRELFKMNELSQERFTKLNDLGFQWHLNWKADKQEGWLQKYAELREFKERNGHCNVTYNSGSLGNWVTRQRKMYKRNMLSHERIAMLNELGFQWCGASPEIYQDMWMEHWRMLKAFKEQNGHCNVSSKSGKLGRWVAKQRDYYRRGTISAERLEKLNELGFQWQIRAAQEPEPTEIQQ